MLKAGRNVWILAIAEAGERPGWRFGASAAAFRRGFAEDGNHFRESEMRPIR
jgi:hypothetical protein